MIKKLIVFFLLTACSPLKVPADFSYKEITTNNFTLASWQKITKPQALYKIYIEGDGYSFNRYGLPTNNPTPHGTLVRELAFGDQNANVIYLARPCQFIQKGICSQRHWTTARFAPEIINAEYEAIKQIAKNNPVILIGYSGGAQVVGLIAVNKPDLQIKKVITIAGNLDHLKWTQYLGLPPLNESMNLEAYQDSFKKLHQHHFVGSDDKVVPAFLVKDFVKNNNLITYVNGANHNQHWESIYQTIRDEN